jgi:hypothetical protein
VIRRSSRAPKGALAMCSSLGRLAAVRVVSVWFGVLFLCPDLALAYVDGEEWTMAKDRHFYDRHR